MQVLQRSLSDETQPQGLSSFQTLILNIIQFCKQFCVQHLIISLPSRITEEVPIHNNPHKKVREGLRPSGHQLHGGAGHPHPDPFLRSPPRRRVLPRSGTVRPGPVQWREQGQDPTVHLPSLRGRTQDVHRPKVRTYAGEGGTVHLPEKFRVQRQPDDGTTRSG